MMSILANKTCPLFSSGWENTTLAMAMYIFKFSDVEADIESNCVFVSDV